MSGGSVRDRIAALQGSDQGHNGGSPTARRGHKLTLKTDEHIKEEFLRRGDGGWSKNVDIGQQQPFMAPPSMPFIKVTSETPTVPKPEKALPDKLPKNVPGSFEPIDEGQEPRASGPPLAEQRLSEKEKVESEEKDVPISKYESLLDEADDDRPPAKARDRSRSRAAPRKAYVEDHEEIQEAAEGVSPREKVIFDPVARNGHDEEEPHSRPKHRRRKSYQRERSERHTAVDDASEDQHRARSRSSRPRSEHHRHSHNGGEVHQEQRRPKHSSRSRSRHEDYTNAPHSPPHTSPKNAHRSSHTLWPSFSQSERRSMSDILDTASIRPRSSHSKTRSDISTTSTHTELSPKKLEFAAYMAGKKLDHTASAPLKPLPKPMGYVRSRSSTGEYSEYYTRERRLLRKPSEDEIIEHIGYDRGRKERRSSGHVKGEAAPWQVKIMQGIARM